VRTRTSFESDVMRKVRGRSDEERDEGCGSVERASAKANSEFTT